MRLRRVMNGIRKRRGFTLIELLVAMVLAGAIVALVYALYIAYSRTILEQQQRWVEIEQVARATVDRLKTYINSIGTGVTVESGQPLIVYAGPYELGFNADLNSSMAEIGGNSVTFGDGSYTYGNFSNTFGSNAETYKIYFPATPTVDYSLSPLDREMRIMINGSSNTYQLSYGLRFDNGEPAFNPDGNRPIPVFTYWGDWDFDPTTPDTLWGDSNFDGHLDQTETERLLKGQYSADSPHGEIVLTKAPNCGGKLVYNTEDLNCNAQWDPGEIDRNHNGRLDRDLLATQLHRVDLNVTVISRTKTTRPAAGQFREAKAGVSVYPHNLISTVLVRTCGAPPSGNLNLAATPDACGGVHLFWDAAGDDGKGEDDIVYYKVMRCNPRKYDCTADPATNPAWRVIAVVPAEGKWRYNATPNAPTYEYFDTDVEPEPSDQGHTTYRFQYRVYTYDCAGQYMVAGPVDTNTITSPINVGMNYFSNNYFMWSEPIPCHRFDGGGATFGGMALFWPAIYEVPGGLVPEAEEGRVEYWIYRSVPIEDTSAYSSVGLADLFSVLALEDPIAKLRPKSCGGGGCTPTTGDPEEIYKDYSYYKFNHTLWQGFDWYMWRDKVNATGRTGLDFSVLPQNGKIFNVGPTGRPAKQYMYWLRVYDTATGCLSQPELFRATFEKANPRGRADKYYFGDIQTFYTETSNCTNPQSDSRFSPPRWTTPIWNLGMGSDDYSDIFDSSIVDASERDENGNVIPGFEIRWFPSKSEDGTRCPAGTCGFHDVKEYYMVREEWFVDGTGNPVSYTPNSRVWIGPIKARNTYQSDEDYEAADGTYHHQQVYGNIVKKNEGTPQEYWIYYYVWPSLDGSDVNPGYAGSFAPDFNNPLCTVPGCTIPSPYALRWDEDDDPTNGYWAYFYYIVGSYRHGSGAVTPQPTDYLSVGVTAPNRAYWKCGDRVWSEFPSLLDANYTYFYQCDLTDYFAVRFGWAESFPIASSDLLMKLEFRDITTEGSYGPWQPVKCLGGGGYNWPISPEVCGTPTSGDRSCTCNSAPFFGSDYYGLGACDPNNPGAGDCPQRWMPNRKYEYRVVVWREDETPNAECPIAYEVGAAMPGMPNMEAALFDNKEPDYMQLGVDYSGISPTIDPSYCHPDTTNYGEVFFYVWRERKEGPDRDWIIDSGWRNSALPNGGVYITQVNPPGSECWKQMYGPYPNYTNNLCAWDRRGIAADRSFTIRDYRPGNLQYGYKYRYCFHVLMDQDGNGPSDHWVTPSWDTWSDMGCIEIRPVFDILFPVCPTDSSLGECRDYLGRVINRGDPAPDPYNVDLFGYRYEYPYDFGDTQAFGNNFRTLVMPPCCSDPSSCSSLGVSCVNNMCGESSNYNYNAPAYNRYTPFTSGAINASFYESAKGWLCPTIAAMNEMLPMGLLFCSTGFWPSSICNSRNYTCGHQTLQELMNSVYFSCLLDPGSYWVMNSACSYGAGCHSAKQDCGACDPFGINFCPLLGFLCNWPGCCLCIDDCWLSCCGYTFAQCGSAIYDPVNCACRDVSCCVFPWAIGSDGGNRALLGLHSVWMEQAMRWLVGDVFQNDFLDPFDYGSWAGSRYTWNHFGAYANPALDDTTTTPDCSGDSPRNPRENLQNFVMVWDQKVWDSGSLGTPSTDNANFATSFMLQDVNNTLGQYMNTPSQYLLVHDFSPGNGDMNLGLYLYFGSPSNYTLQYTLDFDFLVSIDFLGNHWETRLNLFEINFFNYVTRVQGFNRVSVNTKRYDNAYDAAWWRNYLLVCRQSESGNEGTGCTTGCNNTHAFAFTAPQSYFGNLDIEKAVLEKSLPSQGYSKLYFNSDDKTASIIYYPDPNYNWSLTLIDWDVAWWLRIYVGFPTYLGWIPNAITLWNDRIDRLEKDYLRDGKGRIGFWVEHEMIYAKWMADKVAPMTAIDNVRVRSYYGECPPQWMIRNYFTGKVEGAGPGSKEKGGGESGEGVVYAPLTSVIGENIPMGRNLKDSDIEKMLTMPGQPSTEMISVEKIDEMKKVIKQQYTVMRRALPAEVKLEGVPSGFSYGKVPVVLYRDDVSGNYIYAKLLTPQTLKTQLMWTQETVDKFTRRVKEAQLEGKLPFKDPEEILSLMDFPIHINFTMTEDQLLSSEQLQQAFGLYAQQGLTKEDIMKMLTQQWEKFQGRVINIDMSKEAQTPTTGSFLLGQ